LVGHPVAGWDIDQDKASAILAVEKLQVVLALLRLVVGVGLVLEREAEATVLGRDVHRDFDAPALREPAALLHDSDLVGGGGPKLAEVRLPGRCYGALTRVIETGSGWITRVGSNPQQLYHRFQEGRALAVLACRIEEIGYDAREAELIVTEVAEDVETASEMSIEFALDCTGRVKMRGEVLEETDGVFVAGLADVVEVVEEGRDGGDRLERGLRRFSGVHALLSHCASWR